MNKLIKIIDKIIISEIKSSEKIKVLKTKKSFEQIRNEYKLWRNEKNTYLNIWDDYRKIYPEIDEDNFYIGTDADFELVLKDDKGNLLNSYDDYKKYFDNIGAKETLSPTSSSRYKVYKDVVYRFSDHWGRVASCYWNIDYESKGFTVGKCHLKDFSLNGGGFLYKAIDMNKVKLKKEGISELRKQLIDIKQLYIFKDLALKELQKYEENINKEEAKLNKDIKHKKL
jgi:hypothetical protein